MNLDDLKKIIEKNFENRTREFKRVFHGRGNFYEDFSYLTVDCIDEILFVCFYEKKELQEQIEKLLEELALTYAFKTFVVQERYLEKAPCKVIFGTLKKEEIVVENGLKYLINFENRNIGIFPDMKRGREYIKTISKDKNILNLFSYTCAFSVVAISGGAKKIVNVDMAKNALSVGRQNHYLNNLDTKKVKFMPYNILKSWSRIRKEAPYDIIIIDPPSFQKGSFAATKDYEKIIKRLDELASKQCIVLSCLNAPELDTNFIKELFKQNAPSFKFEKRLENLDEFPSNDEEKTLKNMIFERKLSD
ncbi:SAM-dependent methyltransferase [Halarcobacter ebronensis]|uniref:SAM-dependent methyltransferase n=1 Tax=Halarcobacter ebronensis TaxID=1462615 RepID=A0A4Q0YFK7_9BACT|nr:class I SAM-dependent methyltransferase [Halarcobacter ebronensis]RXJ69367.1 SAM-dependent methyltransferase [Halarcobacter ebronensis]